MAPNAKLGQTVCLLLGDYKDRDAMETSVVVRELRNHVQNLSSDTQGESSECAVKTTGASQESSKRRSSPRAAALFDGGSSHMGRFQCSRSWEALLGLQEGGVGRKMTKVWEVPGRFWSQVKEMVAV